MSDPLYPVAILAGGLATRLRPLTTTIPKALIDINGEPFIAHQLRLLKNQGVTEVIICVGFLGEQIQDFLGHGKQFGLSVKYVFDGQQLLDTAGALKQALPLLGKTFFVIYGDSYLNCDFRAVQDAFIQDNKLALMTVYKNNNQWDKSNIAFNNGQIQHYTKTNPTPNMQHIDYGLSLFDAKAFERVPKNVPYSLANLTQELLAHHHLAGYEVDQRFYEIGSLNGISELSGFLREQQQTVCQNG